MEVNRRQVAPQDVSWFIDLSERGRLDLDPPYQRRSVWSINDRRYFLDTIFSNLPTPALFIHRTMDGGRPTYHVVDGKQRLETIIRFSKDEFALGDSIGDTRLAKKRFSQLDGDLKDRFWNYQLIVEQLTSSDPNFIREIFDRVNRNTRRLTRQEIRHARFEGWFAKRVDTEADADASVWRRFGIVTPSRARRMGDAQFIAEIIMLTIDKKISGFDQDLIDETYSVYDDSENLDLNFDQDAFELRFGEAKTYLGAMADAEDTVAKYAKTAANFYSLWAILILCKDQLPPPPVFASKYASFMSEASHLDLEKLAIEDDAKLASDGVTNLPETVRYYLNVQSATTDLGPRIARHEALQKAIIDDESATVN